MSKIHMTTGDRIILISVIAMAGTLFFILPGWIVSGGTDVEIRADEKAVGRYPLGEDRLVHVEGPLGTTDVSIKDGRAAIVSSPCPKGICMHMGEIGRHGGVLVCVPNKVLVTVGTGRPDGLDAVSR
jgi:hypothetical protein